MPDDPRLEELRARIREVDRELIRLVGARRDLVLEVGRVKEDAGLPVLDPAQEARVVRRAAALARELGVDEELVRDVIWRIMASARDEQEGQTRWGPPLPPPEAAPGVSGSGEAEPEG
ncbi:MAG: chorismate mutase [Gemmatimonadota bacterium]